MHFEHKAFEQLVHKKEPAEKKKKQKVKPKEKAIPEEGFAFLAWSNASTSSSGRRWPKCDTRLRRSALSAGGAHPLYRCEHFHSLVPLKRRQLVKDKGLCMVCYSVAHEACDCHLTNYKCWFGCNSRHHSDLHVTAEDYKRWREMNKPPPPSGIPAGPEAELSNLIYSMDLEEQQEPNTLV